MDYTNWLLQMSNQLENINNSIDQVEINTRNLETSIQELQSGDKILQSYIEQTNQSITLLALILMTSLIFTFIMRCFK